MIKRILIVGDVERDRELIRQALAPGEYRFAQAQNTTEALELLKSQPADVVIAILPISEEPSEGPLARLRTEYRLPKVSVAPGEFCSVVGGASDGAGSDVAENQVRHRFQVNGAFPDMVGHSSVLQQVLHQALRAARTDCTILVQGETGTGKELLARGIHMNSNRSGKPFVTLNCGAIPRDLFESELFGHVQGSFTGAVRNRTGKAEAANLGTLFLDEVGELPLESQTKVLRLIQQGEIERVGAAKPTTLDIRIIAATNRDLPKMVKERKFREDLYHRLNVIPLLLPSLRQRLEDIPELVRYFFQRSCAKHCRPLNLPRWLVRRFVAYTWPGNIRELENALERIVVLTQGAELELNDLPAYLRSDGAPLERISLNLPPKGVNLKEIEKELIRQALKKNGWNRSRAARYLGVTRDTLNYRLRKYKLNRSKATGLALESVTECKVSSVIQ